jgi:taurine dioxygenase
VTRFLKQTVRALGGNIGAIVENADLRTASEETMKSLKAALYERCVVVVPGQSLSPEDHIDFARRFGQIWMPPGLEQFQEGRASGYLEGYPPILVLANCGRDKAVADQWHTDSAYVAQPPAISILAARTLPDHGGDTMFSNQMAAYDRLTSRMQSLLSELRIEFSSRRAARTFTLSDNSTAPTGGSYHPVVRTHPETGRKALYLSIPGTSCARFEGMSEEESMPIIKYLYDLGHEPDLVHRHMWRPGDVVIWDNRICRHLAVHDYGEAPRVVNRITVAGEVPA